MEPFDNNHCLAALAALQKRILNGIGTDSAKSMSGKFARAMKAMSDGAAVWTAFVLWRLTDPEGGVVCYVARHRSWQAAIKQVAHLYETRCLDPQLWAQACAAADKAQQAAWAAQHESGAYACLTAFACAQAATDPKQAALVAEYAGELAYAMGMCCADAHEYYASADRQGCHHGQADKLLELLRDAA